MDEIVHETYLNSCEVFSMEISTFPKLRKIVPVPEDWTVQPLVSDTDHLGVGVAAWWWWGAWWWDAWWWWGALWWWEAGKGKKDLELFGKPGC